MTDNTLLDDAQKKILVSLTNFDASKSEGMQLLRKNITQIKKDTGVSRSHLSKTLKKMKENGWLESEEQGREVKYRVSPEFELPAEKQANKQRDIEQIESTELAEIRSFVDSLDQIPLRTILYGHPKSEENLLTEKIQIEQDEAMLIDILRELISKIYEKRVPMLEKELEEEYNHKLQSLQGDDALESLKNYQDEILSFLAEAYLEKETVFSSWFSDDGTGDETAHIVSYLSDSRPEAYETVSGNREAEKFIQDMAESAQELGEKKMMLTVSEEEL